MKYINLFIFLFVAFSSYSQGKFENFIRSYNNIYIWLPAFDDYELSGMYKTILKRDIKSVSRINNILKIVYSFKYFSGALEQELTVKINLRETEPYKFETSYVAFRCKDGSSAFDAIEIYEYYKERNEKTIFISAIFPIYIRCEEYQSEISDRLYNLIKEIYDDYEKQRVYNQRKQLKKDPNFKFD